MVCVREEGDRERVLGLHLTGPNAGEMMQGFTLALRYSFVLLFVLTLLSFKISCLTW